MTALTIATLNLWGQTEDWRQRMELAARQLAGQKVDVLLVQEAGSAAGYLAQLLGMQCSLTGEDSAPFALAVLSSVALEAKRRAILPAQVGEQRFLLSHKIVGHEIWVHSTHLSHELDAGSTRELQVARIADEMQRIDAEALHVIGGDMNADPGSSEMRFLRGHASLAGRSVHLQDAWLRHHEENRQGHTWCMLRGEARRMRSVDVDRRIDYLYVGTRSADGRGTIEASGKVCDTWDEAGRSASDHCGVWARVQC